MAKKTEGGGLERNRQLGCDVWADKGYQNCTQ